MDVSETLSAHRSIRKFKTKPIGRELIDQILKSAIDGSSSSGNLNSYSIILTQDPERKSTLCRMHSDQNMIEEAPLLITFCSDQHRTRLWLKERGAADSFDDLLGFLVGAFDAVIVAQSLTLAAESKGLGVCYLGTTLSNATEISSFLELPDHVYPVTSLVVGYPDESPQVRNRLPFTSLVHHETYREFDSERLLETYRQKEINGWDRYCSYPDIYNKIKDLGIDNLAQFYTSSIKYSKTYHNQTSLMLMQLLRDKGFIDETEVGTEN